MNATALLTQTALLGADRSPLSPDVSAALQIPPAEDPAQAILEALTTSSLLRKAGYVLSDAPMPLPYPAPPDDRAVCTEKTLLYLERLLSGQFVEALPELLDLLVQYNLRLPPETLPELLNKGLDNRDLIRQIRPALGARGAWLAAQHLRWESFFAEPDWHTGTFPERLQWLTEQRRQAPENALAALAATWLKERPNHKVRFLETLAIGQAADDRAFLQEAATDKNPEISLMANRLLDFVDLSPQQALTLLTCFREDDLPRARKAEYWPERYRYSFPWHKPGILPLLSMVLPEIIGTVSRFGFYEKSGFVQSVIIPACFRCPLHQLNAAFTQVPDNGELPSRCWSIVQFRNQVRQEMKNEK